MAKRKLIAAVTVAGAVLLGMAAGAAASGTSAATRPRAGTAVQPSGHEGTRRECGPGAHHAPAPDEAPGESSST